MSRHTCASSYCMARFGRWLSTFIPHQGHHGISICEIPCRLISKVCSAEVSLLTMPVSPTGAGKMKTGRWKSRSPINTCAYLCGLENGIEGEVRSRNCEVRITQLFVAPSHYFTTVNFTERESESVLTIATYTPDLNEPVGKQYPPLTQLFLEVGFTRLPRSL
jgi:hypothetical protein